MTGKSDDKLALDLGLVSLLNSEGEKGPIQESEPKTEVPGKVVPESLDPYQVLAAQGNWADLSNICESKLRDSEGDLSSRLWWIKSQLSLAQMPLSILAAPLETATVDISNLNQAKLAPLAGSLLREIGKGLQTQNDSSTALHLLERAFALGACAAADLAPSLDAEIESARRNLRRRQNSENSQKLERLENLSKSLFPKTPASVAAKLPEDIKQSANSAKFLKLPTIRFSAVGILMFGLAVSVYLLLQKDPGESVKEALDVEALSFELSLPELTPLKEQLALNAVFLELEKSKQKPATIPNKDKEVVDTSSPALPADPAGQVKAPAQVTLPTDPDDGLDSGGPAPVEVEYYSRPRAYAVVSDAMVYSKPSAFAVSLDRLFQGDKVLVEARVGNWLKLRSRRGKPGYVKANDVVFLPDPKGF